MFFMNYKMLFLEFYKLFISQVDNWKLLGQFRTPSVAEIFEYESLRDDIHFWGKEFSSREKQSQVLTLHQKYL